MERLLEQIKRFIESGNDEEAYTIFRQYFLQNPLIDKNGGDSKLAKVCNPIAFGIFHSRGEWQREIDWWNSVLSTIEKYERINNTNLHKGLPFHNRSLPLLELNRPEEAVQSIVNAIREDERNFGSDGKISRPAYKVGCFLIPIVRLGRWTNNDANITEEEKRFLLSCFESLFQSSQICIDIASRNVINSLSNSDLRTVLLKRYDSIVRNIQEDPLLVAIYSGSIVEEILSILLDENTDLSIRTYRSIASQRPDFVYMYSNLICENDIQRLIDRFAPIGSDENVKKRRIKKWAFEQKIDVARESGLLNSSNNQTMALLSHLLRGYRNLVHPSYHDQLGSQDWGVTFEINPDIAYMLKTALDIVLFNAQLPRSASSQLPRSPMVRTYSSLASPGMPGSFDRNGRFVPASEAAEAHTSTSSDKKLTSMGSTSTT